MMRETAKRLSLRLNGSEYAHLKVLAEGCGMKLEPTLRQLILGAELRSRPPDEIAALQQFDDAQHTEPDHSC